jgi:hypothetical protein
MSAERSGRGDPPTASRRPGGRPQRFSRTVAGQQIPDVVTGSGGLAATPRRSSLRPAPGTIGEHPLEVDPIMASATRW